MNSLDQPVDNVVHREASIGILTYRRPVGLQRCLQGVLECLEASSSGPWPVSEVLVIDNDPAGSARSVVAQAMAETAHTAATTSAVKVRYVHETAPGVANARNRALSEVSGHVLVFIDDDERPGADWPHGLLNHMNETGAALVGGPVLSEFTSPPPQWVTDGRFFDRPDPDHGSPQAWLRSGNLAVDLAQIRAADIRFDPRYREGEDSAFTRAAHAAGLQLRWSSQGSVIEYVPADRFSVGWRTRREYLSHRAWSRSSLDLATGSWSRTATRMRIAAVAVARAAQGIVEVVAGLTGRSKARQVEGLARLAGATGKITEIVAYRRR